MIKYDPNDAVLCWPEGEYRATLETVEEKTSKADNPMYVLTFQAYNGDDSIFVTEYVVIPKFVWKLKRLASALGVLTMFENGSFDPEAFIGHSLTVELTIEKQEGFDDKNRIGKYVPKQAGSTTKPKEKDLSKPVDMTPEEPLPF